MEQSRLICSITSLSEVYEAPLYLREASTFPSLLAIEAKEKGREKLSGSSRA